MFRRMIGRRLTAEHYFKSREEMQRLFADLPRGA